jgi:hypothetical protein
MIFVYKILHLISATGGTSPRALPARIRAETARAAVDPEFCYFQPLETARASP